MSLSKIGSWVLVLAATIIVAFGPARAQADVFKFSLAGLEGGGIFFGEFSATDLNLDGVIVANGIESGGELDSLTVNLNGNAILPDFTVKDPNDFGGLIYKIGTPLLGDDFIPSERYAEIMNFAQFNPDGVIDFASRFDVPGGTQFDDRDGYLTVLIGDPETGQVLFEEYIAVTGLIEVNRVPLPGSLVLVASGLAGLFGLSARARRPIRRSGHSVR